MAFTRSGTGPFVAKWWPKNGRRSYRSEIVRQAVRRESMEILRGRKIPLFERLADPAKRHYTFAVAASMEHGRQAANTTYQVLNALNFRSFCSLRLSVRTPPFH